MSDLKTLKDFKEEPIYIGGVMINPQRIGRVDYEELKQSAIDWVNHYQHLEYIEEENQINCEREIQWIMNFFDINEGDLK